MSRLVLAGLLVACGDNRVPAQPADGPPRDTAADTQITTDAPADAETDAPPPMPDLRWVPGMMDGSILIMPGTFTADSCEMVEQCIGATGTRRLLRFDAVVENAGEVDLVVGPRPPDGVSDETFTWSPCHMHHHFTDFTTYELRDANGVVVTGRKQAFCILDTIQREVGTPSNGYTCTNQGLTAGWADVYSRGLACQWIDITDVAAGTYTVRVVVNPLGTLPESDATNNVHEIEVTF